MKLTDFKVLTFDCYGTLIDWESGMLAGLAPLTDRRNRKLTNNEILEAHARHESTQQLQTPTKLYRDVLAIVYRRLAEEWSIPVDWDECIQYGNSIKNWPAFPACLIEMTETPTPGSGRLEWLLPPAALRKHG